MLLKICGITSVNDALAAASAGADFLGLILVSGSKRFVTPEQAASIIAASSAKCVLVTRDLPLAALQTLVDNLHPYAVQLHGGESAEYASALRRVQVWKAFNLNSQLDLDAAAAFPAELLVADSGGGTGKPCDWRLAAALARRHRLLLAGGLCIENVLEAIAAVQPEGIDISGGVEASPGVKDHGKLRSLAALLSRQEKQHSSSES